MVFLEISATIKLNKILEFNQSKMTFINHLQTYSGYIGFKEKQGKSFYIKISWENINDLKKFMESEPYRVFHGGIITLGLSYSIKTINSSKQEETTNL